MKPKSSMTVARQYYLLLVVALFSSAGCQTVRMDAEPASAGHFATTFSLSEHTCLSLLNNGNQLPLDMYHRGLCHEQGMGVPASVAMAAENYTMAARWGIPEAVTALKRLGQEVPAPDLQQRQGEVEAELGRQHSEAERNKLEAERLRQIREERDYWYRPLPYKHCRSGWCY